jgi:uncharacterized damage-inducible protein DinB
MAIRDLLLPEFDEEMANTRKMLERIPDDKLQFTPHKKSWKLERMAGHTVDMISWIGHTMRVEVLEMEPGQYEPFEPKSSRELLERFDANVREARAVLETATDEALHKTWTMKWQGKQVMQMPRYSVLRSVVFNHLIHHRAQVGMYLRMANIAIPGMYGPSADEPQFGSAEQAA